ncbi:MAG: carboxypeptidase regulatory-like domain-containing protein, partial [Bacteroidales bacterium]
ETSESFTTTITSDYDIGVTFVEDVVEHSVTFTVADTADAAIEGAEIAIEDESTITTDANGEATIDLADDTYDYTVSADGYEDYSGSVEVSGTELTEEVLLQELVSEYTVTFIVEDENSEALEGATVNIDDTDLTTGAGGEATIELADGTYDYTVSADGYEDTNGNIEIVDTDIEEEVTLTSTSTSIGENERTEINIYPNPTSGKVYIETEESYGFIKVYNLTGERIESLQIEDSKNQIDLTGKPDGIYLIEVGGSMESITEKVIKR